MSKHYQDKIDRVQDLLDVELQSLRTERLATRKLLRKIRDELECSWSIRMQSLASEIDTLLGE